MKIQIGNAVLLTGVITKDPVFKQIGQKSTDICELSIAYDKDGQGNSKFMNISCFGKEHAICKSFVKTDKIIVLCPLSSYRENKWTGNNGVEHTDHQLTADFIIAEKALSIEGQATFKKAEQANISSYNTQDIQSEQEYEDSLPF